MFSNSSSKFLVAAVALVAWLAFPTLNLRSQMAAAPACPSGRYSAKLTGWMLDGKTPVGTADYDHNTRRLEVTVSSVALADGTNLAVLIGDDRIGELAPLKDGSATGQIMRQLPDGARVRVFHGERPIVSANLVCVAAPIQTPTPPSPTPTPSPTMTPTPTQTPTPDPTPTASPTPGMPTPDPMPKKTPDPVPSPSV